MQLKEKKIYQN